MEELYSLYLKFNALRGAGASEDFGAALNDVLEGATTVRSIEINAVAAIATESFAGEKFGETFIAGPLLDFYEFQQVWQRYRNLAPLQ